MSSINDSIPSELLFRTFQFFDEYEFVKLREVCKSWLEIIDENRLLWQFANLAREEFKDDKEIVTGEEKNLEWNEMVLRLFDDKSRSTLKEVSLKVKGSRFSAEMIQLLVKSGSTLRVLSIEMFPIRDALLEDLLIALDYTTMPLVDFRLWWGQHAGSSNVKILRRSPPEVGKQVSKEGIALQVLWTEYLPELLFGTSFILHNLVSLSIDQVCDALTLHPLLKPLSLKLKHLALFMFDGHWELELEPLHFPKLEVLQLASNLRNPKFPQWILCPSSLKLSTHDIHQDLPSIAELLIETLNDCTPLSGRCPLLHTFRFKVYYGMAKSLNISNLVKLLIERRAQVEAGMEVDGIKMQNIKVVFLPLGWFRGGEEELEHIKSLVETVIDSDAEKWEIII